MIEITESAETRTIPGDTQRMENKRKKKKKKDEE